MNFENDSDVELVDKMDFENDSDVELVDKILSRKVNPNAPLNEEGDTPLHEAALYDRNNVAKFILETGVNPNVENKDGQTPLTYAAWNYNYNTLDTLLKHGADINKKDNNGDTALNALSFQPWENKEVMIEHLLQNGANPFIKDNEGKIPYDNFSDNYDKQMLNKHMTAKTLVPLLSTRAVHKGEKLPHDLVRKLHQTLVFAKKKSKRSKRKQKKRSKRKQKKRSIKKLY
jgi:ankyrin repeat protein